MLLELERIHNHVADLGALANDVGFGIINTHAQRLRETMLRLNKATTGHRLLRAAVTIGGARLTALPDLDVVTTVAREVEELRAITLGKSTVRDRFTGTRGTQPRSSPQPRHAGLRGPRLRGRHRCPQGPSIRRTRRTLRGCA